MKEKIQKKNNKENKRELFILRIVTTFLKFTPVLFLIYLYIISLQTGQKIFTPVIENTNMTIIFIGAMLGPFNGICCDFVLENLMENKNIVLSEIILGIIAFGQIVLLNLILAIPIIYVIYKFYDKTKINFSNLKSQIKIKKCINNLLISTFTMAIVIMCTYVRVKIGF